jgi:hypothetical protein
MVIDKVLVNMYSSMDCTGSFTVEEQQINRKIPFPPYSCLMFSCDALSDDLPLASSLDYSVWQDFQSGSNLCMNGLQGYAFANDRCLSLNDEQSYYVHYPWIASYDSSDCDASVMTINFTYPVGCLSSTTPAASDDAASYEYVTDDLNKIGLEDKEISMTMLSLQSTPSEFFQEDAEHVLTSFINKFQRHMTWLQEERMMRDQQKVSSAQQSRELGLFYYYDDDTRNDDFSPYDQYTSFSYTKVSSTSGTPQSSSVLSAGAIAGIVLGGIAFLVVIGIAIAVFVFGWGVFGLKSSTPAQSHQTNGDTSNNDEAIELSSVPNPILKDMA